jgi:integrase/recombinase XerD
VQKLSPGTVTNHLCALRFFYIQTLKKPWSIADTPYPKKRHRLPTILSQEEVAQLIDAAPTAFYRTVLMTLYATGVRNAELTRLKISDVDSQRMVLHVQGGKGRQDRDVMLSPVLLEELRAHWRRLRKRSSVWLFPGNRWHSGEQPMDTKTPRHACQHAARRAGIKKKVYPHVLRHYLPFLTMSSEMGEPGNRSIITARNSNRVDQSLDIVFSVFSALQTIEEAKQLVSWLVAPWSAVRR